LEVEVHELEARLGQLREVVVVRVPAGAQERDPVAAAVQLHGHAQAALVHADQRLAGLVPEAVGDEEHPHGSGTRRPRTLVPPLAWTTHGVVPVRLLWTRPSRTTRSGPAKNRHWKTAQSWSSAMPARPSR